MSELTVICINAQNRPNEVPSNRWVVKGQPYTIIKLVRMTQQQGIAGVKLAEINNDDLFPYTYFRLDRFGIPVEVLESLVEASELETEFV